MTRSAQEVSCPDHGPGPYALICQHLLSGAGLDFVAAPNCGHGPAQAWCLACDEVVQEERGWSERATAGAAWRLYCSTCYRETLAGHRFTGWVQGSDDHCDWSRYPEPSKSTS